MSDRRHNETISSWDDFPVHQTSEFIRNVATSDRNFYDRYYFNLHGSSDEVFAIFGLGMYPNLGVKDAFIAVTTGGGSHPSKQHIVRASDELEDRMDISVGPIKVEIIEPLKKLRVTVAPNEHGVEMDVVWDATIPAHEEPRQYLRQKGKVMFDTQRLAQTGNWTGSLTAGGITFDVTPDRWRGCRDRSWGVRPVGEKEPDGIRQDVATMAGMWNYMPMQFDDHSILYLCHEEPSGARPLEEAVRIWADPSKGLEWLGRPEWDHTTIPGTRLLSASTIRFDESDIVIDAKPLLTNFISIGTGYGIDADWRHGMHQGKNVVQGLELDPEEIKGLAQYGVVDSVGEFTYAAGDRSGAVGYGLYEHGFFGDFEKLGLPDRGAVFP